jgi:hypothetical protein
VSYLTLTKNDLDMTKAVVSFWFKVSSDAIQAARNSSNNDYPAAPPLYFPNYKGIIPLLTFGPQPMIEYWIWGDRIVGTTHVTYLLSDGLGSFVGIEDAGFMPIVAIYPQSLGLKPAENSWIGLRLSPNVGEDTLRLDLTLQTITTPDIKGLIWTPVSVVPFGTDVIHTFWDIYIPDPIYPYNNVIPWSVNMGDTTYEDVSFMWVNGQPEYYGGTNNTNISITPDDWHHILISWDISDGVSTEGTGLFNGENLAPNVSRSSKLWVAVDDVNYTGADLPADWVTGGDPNAIATSKALSVAASGPPTEDQKNHYGGAGNPTYNLAAPGMVCEPLCVPSGNNYTTGLSTLTLPYHCEMAELQIFAGATLDTGVENNRRAFIDYKRDSKGAPIPDKNGKLTLVPVNPAKAVKLIGRKPDVELHKSGNWIKGRNSGSTGVGADGKPISAGQFKPTGVIKKYKPDPSIVVT